MGIETYRDEAGVERCDACEEDVEVCECVCVDCGDRLIECACDND